MCDEDTVRDNEGDADHVRRGLRLSRRRFNALAAAGTVGAAMAMMLPVLPRAANAMDVVERDVTVTTPDGDADCYFVHPATGNHPGVIVWPDILGLRPAYRQMGRRLAEAGHAVLVINPYYRSAPSPVVAEGASFQDPAIREQVMPMARSLTPETNVTDALAFAAFLDAEAAVDRQRGMGTIGYCMGGPMVMRTAAALPERIAAGASFHGSRLVMEGPDSPHLLIPEMEAAFLFAIADNDDERDPDAKRVLRETFDVAGLDAEIEVYEGAMHGWCALDSAAYDHAQAERAWTRLLALFETALA